VKKRSAFWFPATSILAMALLWSCVPNRPAEHRQYRSLEQAVEAGAVDEDLVKALGSKRGVDAIVSFRPGAAAEGLSATEADAVFAEEQTRKQAVLGRLVESISVLQDYKAMPLAFVRVASPPALLRLLNDPDVLGASSPRVYDKLLAAVCR
jgi:hypothetical protein